MGVTSQRRESRVFEQRFERTITCEEAATIRPVVRFVGNSGFDERASHKGIVVDSLFGQIPVVVEHGFKIGKKSLTGVKQFAEVIEALVWADCFYMLVFHAGYYTIFS